MGTGNAAAWRADAVEQTALWVDDSVDQRATVRLAGRPLLALEAFMYLYGHLGGVVIAGGGVRGVTGECRICKALT